MYQVLAKNSGLGVILGAERRTCVGKAVLLQTIQTELGDVLETEPTTLLIDPAEIHLPPAITPPNGIQLVADVRRLGHSINNMLIPLMASMHILQQDGPRSLASCEAIREANQSIDQIRLLVQSYMEANRPSRIDLSRIATDIIHVFDQSLRGRGIRVESLSEACPTIVAPMAEVSDALTNLITNAADAMPSGGIIRIRTSEDAPCGDEIGRKAILEVTDTGCGIPKSRMAQAFVTPFTSKPDGHGIGLPTIAHIMQHVHGRIKITSAPGRGTTIQLRFPTAA